LPLSFQTKRPFRPSRDLSNLQETFQTFKRPFRPSRDLSDLSKMTDAVIANVVEESARFVEHPIGDLEFSAYKYHHNRNPYFILFIKNGSNIYIEMINEYTHRRKMDDEIVMPFEVMKKNENLKMYYDLSVKMLNTRKSIYYDTVGVETKHLIQTYDTDSDTDEDEERQIRHWGINCDCVWKNLRVSKDYNIYYNMNPFTYSYDVNTVETVEAFLRSFDTFAKSNRVAPVIKAEILARDS
jgi:hypothetical protein